MVQRIVRDLEKKGPERISLKDEEKSVSLVKPDGALDCSKIGKRKNISPKKTRKLNDVVSQKKPEKVYFLHIDARESVKYWKMGELIRLASAGLVILFVLNIINVYHKGLTLKNDVIATAYSGYEDLLRAGDAAVEGDFIGAEQTFDDAAKNFESAIEEISFLNSHQNYFLTKEKTVDSAQGLLDAARNLSLAGKNFVRGVENLQQLPALFIRENMLQEYSPVTGEGTAGKQSLTEKLKEDLTYIQTATEQINIARQNLEQVSPDVLTPSFREKLELVKEKTDQIYELLTKTQQKIPAILDMLGDRYPHRYLILLQNDTEARPTGGFIGSYLIVDLNDGYITKFDFHDIYELDGQLHEDIEPPEDIAMVSDTWRMRDSNYSPDFTISAEKAAWFLQKQNGPSVDSVIAINQSFIGDLLELTGPVQISSLDAPLNKENFQLILSYIIESKISGEDKPKEVLRELIPAFQKKLFSGLPLDQVILAILDGFNEKKIMLYSRHEKVQNLFDEFGMSNRVRQTAVNEDYLQVVATSIGGNKSDKFINQTIKHYTLIRNDGTIMNEVAITRAHTWNGKDLEHWQGILSAFSYNDLPPHIIDILGRGDNKVFIKIYVPQGSELVNISGIGEEEVYTRIDEEIGKTYFMFQMKVSPLTKEKVSITYTLPAKLSMHPADTYKFFAQNQPSFNPSFLEKKIYFKPGLQSYRHYPDGFKKEEDGSLFYASELNEDLYLSALVGN